MSEFIVGDEVRLDKSYRFSDHVQPEGKIEEITTTYNKEEPAARVVWTDLKGINQNDGVYLLANLELISYKGFKIGDKVKIKGVARVRTVTSISKPYDHSNTKERFIRMDDARDGERPGKLEHVVRVEEEPLTCYGGFSIGDRVVDSVAGGPGTVVCFIPMTNHVDGSHWVTVKWDREHNKGNYYTTSLSHIEKEDEVMSFDIVTTLINLHGESLLIDRTDTDFNITVDNSFSVEKTEVREFLRKLEELLT